MNRPTTRQWARRLGLGSVRRVLLVPRHVADLRTAHVRVQEQVARLDTESHDIRLRAGQADDALARLSDAVARLTEGLADAYRRIDVLERDLVESRRLSLRVAQLTDVVMDRLADAEPVQRPS